MYKTTIAVVLFTVCCVTQTALAAVNGRYVHVKLPGSSRTLSLAEVQVFSGNENVALKKKTTQTNTANGGESARAVDGNTNGDWGNGSITHTTERLSEPEWEVDLGAMASIDKIVVWNRDGFETRLDGFQISVLDEQRKAVWGTEIAKPERGATELPTKPDAKCSWAGKAISKVAIRAGGGGGGGSSNISGCTPGSVRMAIEDLIASFAQSFSIK